MPFSWNVFSLTEELEAIRGRSELAVVLGSGLSVLAETVERIVRIPYAAIPGLGATSVEGHPGRLTLARIGGKNVLLFEGRFHAYEGHDMEACGAPVSLAAALGSRRIVVTQAAGSLDRRLAPGSWLIPSDVATLPARFALAPGCVPARQGGEPERRRASAPLISTRLRSELLEAARAAGIAAAEGTLLWTTGPSYETAAETRAAVLIGARAASMSSLPELMAARALGLDAALASRVTNYAAPLGSERLDHSEVCRRGAGGVPSLGVLLTRLLARTGARR
jgi:purine-nucleoside phosphorylase